MAAIWSHMNWPEDHPVHVQNAKDGHNTAGVNLGGMRGGRGSGRGDGSGVQKSRSPPVADDGTNGPAIWQKRRSPAWRPNDSNVE